MYLTFCKRVSDFNCILVPLYTYQSTTIRIDATKIMTNLYPFSLIQKKFPTSLLLDHPLCGEYPLTCIPVIGCRFLFALKCPLPHKSTTTQSPGGHWRKLYSNTLSRWSRSETRIAFNGFPRSIPVEYNRSLTIPMNGHLINSLLCTAQPQQVKASFQGLFVCMH